MTEALRIAAVASEASPLARGGGAGDVLGALARAVAARGHEVLLFLPAYRDLTFPAGARRETAVAELRVPGASGLEPASLIRVRLPDAPGLTVLLVQHHGDRRFFDRPGLWLEPATGARYPDNAERYAFFGRAVLEGLKALDWKPDMIHALDARAAWTLGYLRRTYAEDSLFTRTGALLTALDLGDQEPQAADTLVALGLAEDAQDPWAKFKGDDQVPLLKVALRHADLVVLPSRRYAADVLVGRERARGLAGVLAAREKDTVGIVPGIDTVSWDPANDASIAAQYDARDVAGKAACRRALAERAGWPTDPAESTFDWPIVGMIARLTGEEGLGALASAMERILALDVRLFVLGLGERTYHALFEDVARSHPERVFARLTFDDRLAREIVAGADAFLLPQHHAPGARQALRSLRYGTPPIAHASGAFADAITDFDPAAGTGTGFLYESPDADGLLGALERAIDAHRQPAVWRRAVRNALSCDTSYAATAAAYEDAYRDVRRRVEARRFSLWALGVARQ